MVAAGTATWQLGKVQNNSTSVRVQLKEGMASRLGEDYIVLLSNRFSGYPFYSPYWKKAKDGFDISILVSPPMERSRTLLPSTAPSWSIGLSSRNRLGLLRTITRPT